MIRTINVDHDGLDFQAIVAASDLPLSIIIIGVGEADFDAMDELVCEPVSGQF